MSNSRGGFFSFNRLLGRKNKNEKTVSKCSVQKLSQSTTNLEEIAPQNKILPLAVPNAPFEQLFRITVYLPLGQLYVARIGAKTKLSDLLQTICMDKSLDSRKFEFRHPTDDTQVFDFSFTVGEVGLNEIKLMQRNSKEDVATRYRIHSNIQENRQILGQHTMSAVSPYSSTNSLNSSESSGMMMNQRSNNRSTAQNRKKRFAPRPPTQIAVISGNKSKDLKAKHIDTFSEIEQNRPNLARQNIHVSSPNLAVSANYDHDGSTESTTPHSYERRKLSENTTRKPLSNRPLSIQLSRTTEDEYKNQQFERTSSLFSQNHNRTSSATSDITTYKHSAELQSTKRPPICKKKAPAPPPRTISALSSEMPIASPRNEFQKLSEEDMKDETSYVEGPDANANVISKDQLTSTTARPFQYSTNISKVMLNVSETGFELLGNITDSSEDQRISEMNICSSNENEEKFDIPSQSQIENISSNNKIDESVFKKVLMVEFNGLNHETVDSKIEQDENSKQVNEIIEEAVTIDEGKPNTRNVGRFETTDEINNNEGVNDLSGSNWNDINFECKDQHIDYVTSKIKSTEVPIQPILNDTRKFNFHEYSDNSLPTSTTSTLNTIETPSTGPESLITSDIEDGYKGNELEKKRKVETPHQDSKEEFIESQFEFLQEHLDTKTNLNSDEETTFDFNKKKDIISSTLLAEQCDETYLSPQLPDKTVVINELTQIINGNRFDTFIKPTNKSNDSVGASQRSTLSNFHISAYAKRRYDDSGSQTMGCNHSGDLHSEKCEQVNVIESQSNASENDANDTPTGALAMSKQIGRSMSFNSTSLTNEVHAKNMSEVNMGLAETSRSNSCQSLTGTEIESESHSMGMSRQKSTSELSIANTPSLQSIEIMKSILKNSKNNLNCSKDIQKFENEFAVKEIIDSNNQKKCQENEELHSADKRNLHATNKPKTWQYQGPPSVNLSTWGERPKSMVCIKSDKDYISGGTSRMATLQKRFNELAKENLNDVDSSRSSSSLNKYVNQSESSCKLPIVRSVEYKKNIFQNVESVPINRDIADSTEQVPPFRPSYEITRIVSEKSFSDSTTDTVKITNSTTQKSFGRDEFKSEIVQRVQSFNDLSETKKLKQHRGAKEKSTNQPEKPIFTQFALRKTGLKQKMLDECHFSENESIDRTKKIAGNGLQEMNPIPTAPKPPPIPEKIVLRPGNNRPDPRNLLLDSIRNFNRGTLKRKVL